MPKSYLIRIDNKDMFNDGVIYYDKLEELKKKISSISECEDVNLEQFYKIVDKYYIMITTNKKCLDKLIDYEFISEDDILTDDDMFQQNLANNVEIYTFDDKLQQSETQCVLF
jgi:hypothetical protein